jgi:hypothetical protein
MTSDDPTPPGPGKRRVSVRLIAAESCYAVLALVATFTLDGVLRTALWLFFLWLAIKTLMAARSNEDE